MNIKDLTVLIVDDNENNLQVAAQILNKAGYEVLLATDGRNALELAREEKPDVILLDVMMPDMDGLEVCRQLKSDESLRDIPLIFLSAKDADASIEKGLMMGGADYVIKPFSERVLLARVYSHIERSILHKELKIKNKALEELNLRLDIQIQNNIHLLATINDQIRNPLSIVMTLIEMDERENNEELIEYLNRIDSVIDDIDRGFIESDKVMSYLKKHHDLN